MIMYHHLATYCSGLYLFIMVYRQHAIPLLAVYRFHYFTPLVALQGTLAFVEAWLTAVVHLFYYEYIDTPLQLIAMAAMFATRVTF